MSEITPIYQITPPPLPQWYLNQFPEQPEKPLRWIYDPPEEHVIEACRKLTEFSKTIKHQIHNDNTELTNDTAY